MLGSLIHVSSLAPGTWHWSPDTADGAGRVLQGAGLVPQPLPRLHPAQPHLPRVALLAGDGGDDVDMVTSEAPVCVERVDAAAVDDALDPDVRVDTVEGVRHQVAVGLGAECPGGEAHEHELLGLGQPGVLQQVRQYRHHDVPPVEGEALRLLAGRPRPGVDVAAAVRHVG